MCHMSLQCVSTEIHGYSSLPENKLYSSSVSKRDGSSDAVAKAWLQEILYDGVSFKQVGISSYIKQFIMIV